MWDYYKVIETMVIFYIYCLVHNISGVVGTVRQKYPYCVVAPLKSFAPSQCHYYSLLPTILSIWG